MAEFFNWLVTLFLNVPVEIYVLVLGATGVSLLAQGLKKWFKIENEKWVFAIVLTIASLGSFLDWFLTSQNLPPTVIGIQTTILVGIAQTVYMYAVKPLNMIISIYNANKNAIKKKLAEVEMTKIPKEVKTLEDAQKVVDAVKEAIPALPLVETPTKPPVVAEEGAIAPTVPTAPSTPLPASFEPVPRPVATF